jgi:hypothetical protein
MAGRGRLRATATILLVACASASGCSRPTARQSLPGSCTPFELVSSLPEDGATGVPIDTGIDLRFSDFPEPETVDLNSLLLSSGVQTRLGDFRVDLITRSIRFDLRNWLWPNLTYVVTISSDVASMTGCPARSQQIRFRTGDGPTDPPLQPPRVPTLADDVLPIFAARCAGAACHRQPAEDGGGCLATPPKELSLCDPDARGALVQAPATEVAGMERVLPGDAARSYLLRKLVPGPSGGPVPTTPGHRDPPDAPLDEDQLRVISDWIDGGAL